KVIQVTIENNEEKRLIEEPAPADGLLVVLRECNGPARHGCRVFRATCPFRNGWRYGSRRRGILGWSAGIALVFERGRYILYPGRRGADRDWRVALYRAF